VYTAQLGVIRAHTHISLSLSLSLSLSPTHKILSPSYAFAVI